jgi:ferredoxin
VLGRKANGICGIPDARRCRVSHACATVAVRVTRGVEYDRAAASATSIKGEKDGFQFDLICCREES